MSKEISRRSFLKTGTVVAAGLAVAPNIIIAGEKTPKKEKKKKTAPSDKLNILGVGIGGRGAAVCATWTGNTPTTCSSATRQPRSTTTTA